MKRWYKTITIINIVALFVTLSYFQFQTKLEFDTADDAGKLEKQSQPEAEASKGAGVNAFGGGEEAAEVVGGHGTGGNTLVVSSETSLASSEELSIEKHQDEGTVVLREAEYESGPDDVCRLSTTDYGAASGLHSIVTGLERSGTRALTQLIISSPSVFGMLNGPGCGVLLAETPSDFKSVKPFYEMTFTSADDVDSWRLSDNKRSIMLNATCHAEMHSLIHRHSPLMRETSWDGVDVTEVGHSKLVDRTPGYVYDLVRVMDRTPGVPVIVTERDEAEQVVALGKMLRGNRKSYLMAAERMSNATDMVEAAIRKYPDRVHVVNMTELYANPNDVMTDVYHFLKMEWKPEYLSMDALNRKLRAIGVDEVPPFSHALSDAPVAAAHGSSDGGDGIQVQETAINEGDMDVCELSKTDFSAASGVYAIITGCEHSGTTIMSQLVMSAPGVFGTYECGIQLGATPAEFKKVHPFYQWMMDDEIWGLTKEQAASLLSATCHAEMYLRLKMYSPVYRYPNNASMIIDKTPGYVYDLVRVMDQTPGVPVVVMQKNDEDQKKSFLKRGRKGRQALGRIPKSKEMISKALEKYPERILVVNTTLLYKDPNAIMSGAFEFLGLTWDPEFLTMQALNKKATAVGLREVLPFNIKAANNTGTTTSRFVGVAKNKWIN